jgi:hypothetical protein
MPTGSSGDSPSKTHDIVAEQTGNRTGNGEKALGPTRSLRNIYYLIISSSFHDDYDDTIRTLKMETDSAAITVAGRPGPGADTASSALCCGNGPGLGIGSR